MGVLVVTAGFGAVAAWLHGDGQDSTNGRAAPAADIGSPGSVSQHERPVPDRAAPARAASVVPDEPTAATEGEQSGPTIHSDTMGTTAGEGTAPTEDGADSPNDGNGGDRPTVRVVIVDRGESLWTIARAVYDDSSMWRKIYEANRDHLEDPDKLKVGMKLRVPTGALID